MFAGILHLVLSNNINMTEVEKMLKIFETKPYTLRMGSGKLSKEYKVSVNAVKTARNNYYRKQSGTIVEASPKLPKILLLDIETAPVKAFIWNLWKQNVYIDQIISDWFCISWSAKWLYGEKVYSDVLTPSEAIAENDKRIVESIWKLIDEADIVVGHNSKKFDIVRLNARFMLHGLNPPRPYQQIDTYEVAKKQFGFTSNKLDFLARIFNISVKLDTDFQLWVDCVSGNESALNHMVEYNRHDVEILEEVYLKLRPWIKGHPNIGMYMESNEPVCGNCGCKDLKEYGYYYTSVGRYKTYRCSCGAISRVRISDYPKESKKILLTTIS
jgi:hypothetical protein